MRRWMWFLAGVAALAAIALGGTAFVFLKTRAHGFSARAQPTFLETIAARTAREMALPNGARAKQNPVPDSPEVFAEAKEHWADHCAACHANDGSGQIPLGRQMYPPAPDMRQDSTQRMTDGELFYIIENGIRLSGMPAWGSSKRGEQDSWKIVRFIRRLPSLAARDIQEMEGLNPKSPGDLEEERQEEQFLKGEPVRDSPVHQHHQH
jgi:mono/diheme cytochrome c family protein